MGTKPNLDDYQVFYAEIPQTDYLDDIEIQDDHDSASDDQSQGLSDQQVSQIARDSLAAGDANNEQPDASKES